MLFNTSARFFYYDVNSEGKEQVRFRGVRNINLFATNQAINELAEVYEALTLDSYHLVEKENRYILNS